MFNTMTYATFVYGGCRITAQRTVDTMSGKFFGWFGEINDRDDLTVCSKSLKQFEQQFIQLVDKKKAEDTEFAKTFVIDA